jgi:hypothetical protein
MADNDNSRRSKKDRRESETPSPAKQVDDRGLLSSESASTTDEEPDSALGGSTATRSGTEPAPNPAEERSE